MANEFARTLRKTLTPQEVKLWVHLRNWRKRGFHFRRQSPRDGYILDFVCIDRRVIVEIDGGQHGTGSQVWRDSQRDRHFAKDGFVILRFWNNEIDQNLDGVLLRIDEVLQARPHPAASGGHPPPAGEG